MENNSGKLVPIPQEGDLVRIMGGEDNVGDLAVVYGIDRKGTGYKLATESGGKCAWYDRKDLELVETRKELFAHLHETVSHNRSGKHEPSIHKLKTWPEFYDRLEDGTKKFEIRENDRDFKVGDLLWLCCWDPEMKKRTGRHITMRVTYITDFQQKPGFVVMGIEKFYD